MNNQHILIVEDEENLGVTLSEYLRDKGFQAKHVTNCIEAKKAFSSNGFTPSIVLMDIGLPDGDGIELAKDLKAIDPNFILLFLSALNDPETKFLGLEMGAEDYITKPFDLRELTIRLTKALKTHTELSAYTDEVTLSQLKIRFKSYEALSASGDIIPLGQKECAILELLYSKINQVVSRDEIIEKIWGEDAFPSNRTVDNYIVKLRKWIDTDTSGSIEIKSVRGVGYQLYYKKD